MLGNSAGSNTTTGADNIFIGQGSAYYNQTGANNVIIGKLAGGYGAGAANSYSNNTFIGYQTGYSTTTGGNNFFGGYQAGYLNQTGAGMVMIGYQAGYNHISGTGTTAIGYQAGNAYTGDGGTFIGYLAGGLTTGNADTIIGYQAGQSNTSGYYSTFIGHGAAFSNTSGAFNTALGMVAGYNNQSGNYNVLVGGEAGYGVAANSYSNNTFIGYQTGYSTTTGGNNFFGGYQAGYTNATGVDDVFLGNQSGYHNTASYNSFLGSQAGHNNSTGSENTFLGYAAGNNNTTSGNNTFVGTNAGASNTEGNNNTFIGRRSAYLNTTGGNNIALGYQAGYTNLTGANNVFLGYSAGYYETGSNKLFIDNQQRASEADARTKALVYGVFDAATANQSLTVNGNMNVLEGMVVGAPTGGNKGAGTINAVAVYDDNLQLVDDFVFDKYFDGVVKVEDQPLHGNYQMKSIDEMASYIESNRHLPTIPGREELNKTGKMSVGKLVNHLWETAETQGIYVVQLNDANKQQDLRINALENQKSAQNSANLGESNLMVDSNSELSITNSNTNINEDVKSTETDDAVEARGIEPPDSGLIIPSGPPGPAPASAETYQEEKNNANPSAWSDFKDKIITILNEITFTAKATFEETVAFLGDVTFGGKVKFEDSVVFNRDTAGHAKIKKGDKKVTVKFDKDFDAAPVVTATASGQAAVFQVKDESKGGFTIELAEDAKDDVSFNWMAIATSNTKTTESEGGSSNTEPTPEVAPSNDRVQDDVRGDNVNTNTNSNNNNNSIEADAPVEQDNTNDNVSVQQESNANTNTNSQTNLTSDGAAVMPQVN